MYWIVCLGMLISFVVCHWAKRHNAAVGKVDLLEFQHPLQLVLPAIATHLRRPVNATGVST